MELFLRPNAVVTMASVGKQVIAPQSIRAKALTLIATAMQSVFTLGLAHTNVCASKDGLVMAKLAQRFVCVIQTMVAVLTKLNASTLDPGSGSVSVLLAILAPEWQTPCQLQMYRSQQLM